ncbi:hypothetical protein J5X84_10760 [Streptosporangiaceae bacterium NEAU-GS5]|nr:hypothetical protein [Streptosporangiaceae bacterium NEAU-GS5]
MNVVYAYPWDVDGDPAAAERLRSLGADAVALAASYHTTRAATPQHPAHRLVDARHAAFYLPVRSTAWAGRRLTPGVPDWPGSYPAARDALRAMGLPVQAWTVLTHNTRLGRANPDLVVVNAFGERYPYALCPAFDEVADYCRTLVGEVVALGEPDALILEAAGPLGFRHMGHHEKTDGADWSPVQTALLSLCFCAACAARYAYEGLDVARLRARVRAGVDQGAASVESALADAGDAVRIVRIRLARDLQDLLRAEAGGISVTLHGNADPWAAGPFATVAGGGEADLVVGNCWNDPAVDEAGLRALAALGHRVGAYVLALPPRPADGTALAALAERYAKAGAEEIHWYHGGLAGPARLTAIRDAIHAQRRGV